MEEMGYYGAVPLLMHSSDKVYSTILTHITKCFQLKKLSNICSFYIIAYDHG